MEPQDYCKDVVRQGVDYSALTVAFAPREHRTIVQAMAALRSELFAIPLIDDPGVAQIKLGWWENEIAELRSGRPRHPITQALSAAVSPAVLGDWQVAELWNGLRQEIEGDLEVSNLEAWLEAAQIAGGALSVLESQSLGGRFDMTATKRLGGVQYAARWLLAGRHSWCAAPANDRARFQVSKAMLQEQAPAAAVEALRSALRDELSGRIDSIVSGAVADQNSLFPSTIVGARLALAIGPSGHPLTGFARGRQLFRVLKSGWLAARQASRTGWREATAVSP